MFSLSYDIQTCLYVDNYIYNYRYAYFTTRHSKCTLQSENKFCWVLVKKKYGLYLEICREGSMEA